jgi:hypothetical protein
MQKCSCYVLRGGGIVKVARSFELRQACGRGLLLAHVSLRMCEHYVPGARHGRTAVSHSSLYTVAEPRVIHCG